MVGTTLLDQLHFSKVSCPRFPTFLPSGIKMFELENYNLGQLAIIIQPMGAYLTITITKTQYIFRFQKENTLWK